MYKGKRISVIIAAAGSGKRFGGSIPKQYLKLNDRSVLRNSADAFSGIADQLIAVTDDIERCSAELEGLDAIVIRGGATRQESVSNGLSAADGDIVLIHDGARPFVTAEVIENVIEGALLTGACIPGVTPKDTIRTKEETLNRSSLYAVQTPQGFDLASLRAAYEKAGQEGFSGTDDASVAERAGMEITIAEGDYRNLKITTGEDMPVKMKIGTGYDVHRLVEDRKLILGGVEIPHTMGLLGHSDADVLVHAIMDAILGAMAEGDIGKLFPDTDDQYKGISSILLLEKVADVMKERGYAIGNVDATVVAQKPKLAPYIDEMRGNIAEALGTDVSNVGVKATTTEKLGFEGRQEGISAQAVCILTR